MPTNDERREVARKLRCACPEQFNDILCGIHLANVGIKACAQIVSAHKDIAVGAASRLADLIEPESERMCHIEKYPPESELYFETCSECGCILSASWPGNRHSKTANYCPNCGAKVVNDAD